MLRIDLSRKRVRWMSAVRVEVAELQVLVGQGVEPHRAEERLGWFDQQYRLGKSAVVEAATEVHARLDGDDLKGRQIDANAGQRGGLHDLHEIGADQQQVAIAEADAQPELTVALNAMGDPAGDAHRLASRIIGQATDVHVEPSTDACVLHRLEHAGIGDRGNQRVGQPLGDDLAQQPRGIARAVAVIGQHHWCCIALHCLFRQGDTVGNGVHLG